MKHFSRSHPRRDSTLGAAVPAACLIQDLESLWKYRRCQGSTADAMRYEDGGCGSQRSSPGYRVTKRRWGIVRLQGGLYSQVPGLVRRPASSNTSSSVVTQPSPMTNPPSTCSPPDSPNLPKEHLESLGTHTALHCTCRENERLCMETF